MCEIFSCLSLSFMDSVVSALIFVLNGLYVVWGWLAPNDDDREKLEEYIKTLRNYLNLFTYSDSVLLISKIVILVIMRYVCCKGVGNKNKEGTSCPGSRSQDVSEDNISYPKHLSFNIPGITPVKTTNIKEV